MSVQAAFITIALTLASIVNGAWLAVALAMDDKKCAAVAIAVECICLILGFYEYRSEKGVKKE